MEKEDIIRMAREAWNEAGEGWVVEGWFKDREKAFERFAQLVAAAEREALASEAERNGNTVLAMQIRARDKND